MEITFKYNNKIITTSNLEKKLKRMKISLKDIEIIENQVKKEEIEPEDNKLRQVIVRSTEDNIRRICYVGEQLPTIYELFKHHMWNGKTGIKELTPEFLMTMYYENGNC